MEEHYFQNEGFLMFENIFFAGFEAQRRSFGNIRYRQLCYNLYQIYCIHQKLKRNETQDSIEKDKTGEPKNNKEIPTAPSNLISAKDTKIVNNSIEKIFENLLLPCLSNASRIYINSKNKMSNENLSGIEVDDPDICHTLIAKSFKHIISILKVSSYGPSRNTLYIIFTVLLQLCFCPDDINPYLSDKEEFRNFLEEMLLYPSLWNEWVNYFILQCALQSKAGCGKSWMGKACNALFVRRFLLMPFGVARTLSCLPIPPGELSWNHREAQAKIISGASIKDIEFFFGKIGPQVVLLLSSATLEKDYYCVVCLVMSQLIQRSKDFSQKYILSSLLKPLIQTTVLCESFPSQQDLTDCVEILQRIYMEVLTPSAHLSIMIDEVFHPLFAIAQLPPTCHLKTSCRDIIIRYLTLLDGQATLQSLLVLANLKKVSKIPALKEEVIFKSRDNQISIEERYDTVKLDFKICGSFPDDDDDDVDASCQCLVQILDRLKNPQILLSFYEHLVKSLDFTLLNKSMDNESQCCKCNFDTNSLHNDTDVNNFCGNSSCKRNFKGLTSRSTLLLTDADLDELRGNRMKVLLSTCNLLNAITATDSLTCVLFADVEKIIPILKSLLEVDEQICEDENLEHAKASLVDSTVILMSCFVNEQAKKMSTEDWDVLANLLPTIQKLKLKKEVAELDRRKLPMDTDFWAERLEYAILTRGVITVDNPPPKNTDESVKEKSVNSSNVPLCNAEKLQDEDFKRNTSEKLSYSEAMSLLMSPQIPFIANGILHLSKLLTTKDEMTMKNKEHILELFKRYLCHEDSYVYLMAINGLTSASNSDPNMVLPLLCSAFVKPRHPVTKAKIGEAICRAIEILGPFCSRFRDLICNTLINGLKDADATVRSSSLSSLSQFCKESRYSLGPIIHEVFQILEVTVSTDESLEVKRASVMLITMMMQGLEKDAFLILKDVMLSLYRILKRLQYTESDEILLIHTGNALLEISTITKEFINPKVNLSKKIFITEVP